MFASEDLFRIVIFSDLLLSRNDTANQETLAFMKKTLHYFTNGLMPSERRERGVDLVVIMGNAVDGTDWDGIDENYF